jgi:hypothetical protein
LKRKETSYWSKGFFSSKKIATNILKPVMPLAPQFLADSTYPLLLAPPDFFHLPASLIEFVKLSDEADHCTGPF